MADALAAAVEYLHCASLVHDDLPCFDDAAMRRGRRSVHAAYGEPAAILVGDGLIVLAFQTLADVAESAGNRLGILLRIVSDSVGIPAGLVTGQAMESEKAPVMRTYHAAKTGALFEAATAGGAAAAGADVDLWRGVGSRIGAVYQIADDIYDHIGTGSLGKPVKIDERLGRPNIVTELGFGGAVAAVRSAIEEAEDAIPAGRDAAALRAFIRAQTARFLPGDLISGAI